jgi:hypothetical protein
MGNSQGVSLEAQIKTSLRGRGRCLTITDFLETALTPLEAYVSSLQLLNDTFATSIQQQDPSLASQPLPTVEDLVDDLSRTLDREGINTTTDIPGHHMYGRHRELPDLVSRLAGPIGTPQWKDNRTRDIDSLHWAYGVGRGAEDKVFETDTATARWRDYMSTRRDIDEYTDWHPAVRGEYERHEFKVDRSVDHAVSEGS